jgi:TPR repeat protein
MRMSLFVVFLIFVSNLVASVQSDEALANHNYKKAFEILTKEAKSGDIVAKYNLALMYYMGDGTEQNISKTALLLEDAAKHNYKKAIDNIGRIYMQLLKFDKAIPWLQKNIENGDIEALYLLSEIYIEKGEFKKAKKLVKKAIKFGNNEAKKLWDEYNLEKY